MNKGDGYQIYIGPTNPPAGREALGTDINNLNDDGPLSDLGHPPAGRDSTRSDALPRNLGLFNSPAGR